MKRNKGITLIALIVIIIVLLLLAGITIANLNGENGIFTKVKQSKEKYSISEAKETLELAIANLQIEQEGKGESLKKEDLPKLNNKEIDVRDTSNFPVEIICQNYKFQVDENFQITYVNQNNGTLITYTTEPESYTNKNEVKILIKITNPKGIKSVQEPGESDKLLAKGQTTVGIDYKVNKNGNYNFTVIDMDDNEITKNIYIDLIDTLEPEDFTPEVEKTESSMKIKSNAIDAEATEESTKSGIDHCEYYIIDCNGNATKYETNEINNLVLGDYRVYVIAYDKAGNKKQSNTIDVVLSKQFQKISTGGEYNLAIDNEGNIWSWGFNYYGQLGDGTKVDKISPVQITTETKFKEVSAGNGYDHSLAIDEEGNIWSWGCNKNGQLGNGTTTDSYNPKQITTGTKFIKIEAGECISFAIDENRDLWGWGWNRWGQLGYETEDIKNIPTKLNLNIKVKEISAKYLHNLLIDTEGNLWSWGRNGNGQVGNGKKEDSVKKPIQILQGTKFSKIATGIYYSLALDTNGRLWSWGRNDDGQLGDGTQTDCYVPKQIQTETSFSQIGAITNFSVALDIEGNIWSWGCNKQGQLGDGTTVNKAEPEKIKSKNKFKEILVGGNYVKAKDINGNLWGWGYNVYGQVKYGATIKIIKEPIQI